MKNPVIPGHSRKDLLTETMIPPRSYALWNAQVPRHLSGALQDDFMEIYSGPRVAPYVEGCGLRADISADWHTGWDFETHHARLDIITQVKARRPKVLGLSPPCTWFSGLQNLNWSTMAVDARETAFRQGMTHLQFTMLLIDLQVTAGRKFYFEHPDGALSWSEASVQRATTREGMKVCRFHMCAFGLVSKVNQIPMIKSTKLLTNLEQLQGTCDQKWCPGHPTHQIIQGMEGGTKRSEWAQIYPPAFCAAVANAIKNYVCGAGEEILL